MKKTERIPSDKQHIGCLLQVRRNPKNCSVFIQLEDDFSLTTEADESTTCVLRSIRPNPGKQRWIASYGSSSLSIKRVDPLDLDVMVSVIKEHYTNKLNVYKRVNW